MTRLSNWALTQPLAPRQWKVNDLGEPDEARADQRARLVNEDESPDQMMANNESSGHLC